MRQVDRLATLALGFGALVAPIPGACQVPTASAAWMGTGQNYVAAVRGFGAIGLNPARLAAPDRPTWSLSVPAAQAGFGLNPISLSDLAEYSGQTLPPDVREEWLMRIAADGGQRGLATVAATGLSATWRSFGVQVSSTGLFQAEANEDAAELILFGNAGRTGLPRTFEVEASDIEGFWVSSIALSGGFPTGIRLGASPDQSLTVGATLKLHFGHTAMLSETAGGSLEPDPVTGEAELPVMQTESTSLDNGFGVGIDIGAAWEVGPWAVALTLENLINTFEWDFSSLEYLAGNAFFDVGRASSSFETRAASEAPSDLQDAIRGARFDPRVVVGGAYDLRHDLTLLADVSHRFGDGISLSPKSRAGAGAEWVALPWLTLRAGGSVITDGFRVGGGAGVALGIVNLSGAYLMQSANNRSADVVALTLSFKTQ